MKLLIIEDERKVAESLAQGLKEAGYEITVADDGREGLALAKRITYDLVVLDIMLPGLDGWSVLDALRHRSATPVILLTARSEVEDKVRGLRAGADDYMVKPFAFSELVARIESILRRGRPVELGVLQAGDLVLDPIERHVVRGGRRLSLAPKEFLLLQLLMRRGGEVLSRATIASAVWGIDFDTDTNTVDVAVRRLRAKIDEDFDIKLIHTVRGAGYRLGESDKSRAR